MKRIIDLLKREEVTFALLLFVIMSLVFFRVYFFYDKELEGTKFQQPRMNILLQNSRDNR